MKIISNNLNASLSLLLSSGLLFGAYFLEFYLSLIPCDLCIKQRIVHVSILVLSLLIFPLYTFYKLRFIMLSILNLLWLVSSSLAFYHFGIEKKLWEGFSECSSNLIFNENTLDQLLSKMSGYIDVIVPRGGKGLVAKVQKFSNVHVIGHLEGLCHIYVDKTANIKMARDLIINAKMRRTSICGAVETLLIEEKALGSHAKEIINALLNSGCEVRADKKINKIFKGKLKKTTEKDWKTEYLDAIISVKTVKNVKGAVEHILKYGTMHTDSIITNNKKNAEVFLNGVNSSIAMHNVSTQFADGGEFGFGGEIGISTNKLPPRGPVGINQLTSYKYLLSGKGIIRP